MGIQGDGPRGPTVLAFLGLLASAILLMGATSLAALFYTHGDVGQLVVMYSINVFLTFSLSMFGMLKSTWHTATTSPKRCVMPSSFSSCPCCRVMFAG